jgi:hypothetical protein
VRGFIEVLLNLNADLRSNVRAGSAAPAFEKTKPRRQRTQGGSVPEMQSDKHLKVKNIT